MPLKIRWSSKEYISIALLLLGGCGLFQVLFIGISQYFLSVGNYLVITIVPLGIIFALYFATLMIYEAFAQVERKDKLNSSKMKAILTNSIVRPLLINFAFFTVIFFVTYFISISFNDNQISFIVAEVTAGILCLLIANYFEKNYAKVRRF